MLHAVRNFNTLQTFAATERLGSDYLQRGREPDVLYRASNKNLSFPLLSVHDLPRAQLLQTLVQLHALQLVAVVKRPRADLFHT